MNYANVWVAPNKGLAIQVMTNAAVFEATGQVVTELIRQVQASKILPAQLAPTP